MNVTSNAYYSPQYLDKQKRSTRSQYSGEPEGSVKSSTRVSKAPVLNRANSTPLSVVQSTIAADDSIESDLEDEESYDPDALVHEITPAQLIIQQSNTVTPHRVERRGAYKPREQTPEIKGYDGYYINQKKRYEESPYKPKLYTHKTFRDVFNDKEESTDKYNPMEFVFPEGEKKSKFAKNVQFVLGKDNYDEYNYYDHNKGEKKKKRKKKINEPTEVFVKELSDDDEEDYTENGPKIYLTEEEQQKAKKNRKFTKVFKSKMKRARKELGKDFVNNAIKQQELESRRKEEKSEKKRAEEEDKQIALKEEAERIRALEEEQRRIGQNPEFHPIWNYILSWLVYDASISKTPAADEEPVENKEQQETSKSKKLIISSKNFKNIKKNYLNLVHKWNEPVSHVFNEPPPPYPTSRSIKAKTLRSFESSAFDEGDGDSKEFVIEYDDDGTEITQELYYNPVTKQLEATPPTSYSSLDPSAKSVSSSMMGYGIDTTGSAVAIISNINALIKSIKIMKILFAPIDVVSEYFPNLQTIVILVELVIFVWILYEVSLLIDALCMMVKAVCAPMIAMGRFMNRIM
ncbi:predicted protein [Scheffersomyces stipitis CBS 6054]|uniref:Uncharacterized protein n=1 Tax=Scheffersomyces stipitis (strain ATCC 58785 / CBS 6054 / NBRC 10063 / NRRL Y-11545) TaxID=322104 RepID=A3GI34_PICST|nr:predicted protein [Scheffersomyces stipitis CBS 6054]EAZ62919.2 predicted protein [Scheffersomyces stipitis CBS 6054]